MFNDNDNPPVYPKAVCAFCKHSFTDDSDPSYYDYSCKKHKFQRTIHPVTGEPAFYKLDVLGQFAGFDPREEYGGCVVFNTGECEYFEKDEEKSLKLLVQKVEKVKT